MFDGPQGKLAFADLFRGRSQLILKHFMLGPGWDGCVGCSFEVDNLLGALTHIEHHDVAFVSVARAPIAEIEAYRARMGWDIHWVSSFNSDFNFDFEVSYRPEAMASGDTTYNYETKPVPIEELSGLSVFFKSEAGEIFHTYSTFGRGRRADPGAAGDMEQGAGLVLRRGGRADRHGPDRGRGPVDGQRDPTPGTSHGPGAGQPDVASGPDRGPADLLGTLGRQTATCRVTGGTPRRSYWALGLRLAPGFG